MKIKLLFPVLFAALFISCNTTYYQVYKAEASEELTQTSEGLVYEDENCRVIYNLWDNGGNIGFRFYNKTDEDIRLNMEESYFILNGLAHDYYQDRVFSTSSSKGASSKSSTSLRLWNPGKALAAISAVENSFSEESGISYMEKELVVIPARTSKVISEYDINRRLFRDCDLYKYPRKRQVNTKRFSHSESPFVFSNRLAYYVEGSLEPVKFENEFHVTSITNYPENEILESKQDEFCGQKSRTGSEYIKDASPDKFYIVYDKKQNDNWKH